jgi:hypothetical protein
MKIILAIDPGNKQSGWACVQDGKLVGSGVLPNNELLHLSAFQTADVLAIEWIQAMGMAVGQEVFQTCMWVGRFVQVAKTLQNRPEIRLVPRGVIKHHHCGKTTAKDANVTQALRDKYGEKGTKKAPGYFFGVSSHAWQAFAVAAYIIEGGTHANEIHPL